MTRSHSGRSKCHRPSQLHRRVRFDHGHKGGHRDLAAIRLGICGILRHADAISPVHSHTAQRRCIVRHRHLKRFVPLAFAKSAGVIVHDALVVPDQPYFLQLLLGVIASSVDRVYCLKAFGGKPLRYVRIACPVKIAGKADPTGPGTTAATEYIRPPIRARPWARRSVE